MGAKKEVATKTPDIKSAIDKINDTIRYSIICAAALDSGRCSQEDIQETLENEIYSALNEALVALGGDPPV